MLFPYTWRVWTFSLKVTGMRSQLNKLSVDKNLDMVTSLVTRSHLTSRSLNYCGGSKGEKEPSCQQSLSVSSGKRNHRSGTDRKAKFSWIVNLNSLILIQKGDDQFWLIKDIGRITHVCPCRSPPLAPVRRSLWVSRLCVFAAEPPSPQLRKWGSTA